MLYSGKGLSIEPKDAISIPPPAPSCLLLTFVQQKNNLSFKKGGGLDATSAEENRGWLLISCLFLLEE